VWSPPLAALQRPQCRNAQAGAVRKRLLRKAHALAQGAHARAQ
jgi:hypothetical protein